MTIQQIDLTRYWELVQLEKNQGESRELLDYRVIFSYQIYFESRKYYLPVIESFIQEKIDGEDFHDLFLTIWRNDRDQIDVLEQNLREKGESTFATDDKAKPFYDCIDRIFADVEALHEMDLTNAEEEEFRAKVTEVFGKMQEILKEG